MEIIIKATHSTITKALKEYAKKKASKIEKFHHNIQNITITLDVTKSAKEDERQIASGIIDVSQAVLKASEKARDMYAAIDLLIDKLEKQLKKHKNKQKDHKKNEKASIATPKSKAKPAATTSRIISPEKEAQLYIPKPMDIEDAALHIQDRKIPFLMFRNIRTQEINVIYAVSKTKYSVIEP